MTTILLIRGTEAHKTKQTIKKNNKNKNKKPLDTPVHLICLHFHKRAWFSNWQMEINDILLQPTMKASIPCQDYLPATNAGQIL